MPQVICTLENASNDINGVKFEQTDGGMLSEEISNEAADYFCQIPGYTLKDDGAAARVVAAAAADAKAKAEAKAAADAAADQVARDAAARAAADSADAAAKEADELAALTARAVELGVEVKSTWKAARLTAEIKRAEEAKAAADAAGQ